jgi:hypothetical protein
MPLRQLRELDQAVLRRLRIDKRNAAAGMTDARFRVEQRDPIRLQLGQSFVDVLGGNVPDP